MEAARTRRGLLMNPLVFYGSSSIRLWKDLASDLACPAALNLGFGGSTLEACAYFFDRLVVPERAASLVLYAGDNDLGDGRAPEHVARCFHRLAEKLETTLGGIPFGFISVKPSPARFPIVDKIRETNRLISLQINERKNAYFIDVFNSMLRADQTPRPELFESDGLHINRAGYELWSKLLAPYRNRMFITKSYAIQAKTLSSAEE